ncbi:MAG TPA: hypothetical protein VEH27_03375 [Methylomirabilota bacterium]|nr:hypothetical protein [Methylomirabilota bacterium]
MIKRRFVHALLAITLGFASLGCSSTRQRPSAHVSSPESRVEHGMLAAEVKKLFGKPARVSKRREGETWIYTYREVLKLVDSKATRDWNISKTESQNFPAVVVHFGPDRRVTRITTTGAK